MSCTQCLLMATIINKSGKCLTVSEQNTQNVKLMFLSYVRLYVGCPAPFEMQFFLINACAIKLARNSRVQNKQHQQEEEEKTVRKFRFIVSGSYQRMYCLKER